MDSVLRSMLKNITLQRMRKRGEALEVGKQDTTIQPSMGDSGAL